MDCYVHVRDGEAEIWVSHQTAEETVRACVRACEAQGCRVILYRSGTGDLAALTGDLLQKNRDIEI